MNESEALRRGRLATRPNLRGLRERFVEMVSLVTLIKGNWENGAQVEGSDGTRDERCFSWIFSEDAEKQTGRARYQGKQRDGNPKKIYIRAIHFSQNLNLHSTSLQLSKILTHSSKS